MIANIPGVLASGSPSLLPVSTVNWTRGADGTIVARIVDGTGAAVNLSGRVLFLGVSASDAADVRLFVRQADNTDEAGGVCTFTIAAADTAALAGGRYRFDVWEQSTDGRVPVTRTADFILASAIVQAGDTPSSPGPIPPVAGWSVAHVSDLAALPVLGTSTGRRIFVAENLKTYVLVANVAGAADGFFVVAPPDDTSRQWAWDDLLGGGMLALASPDIDVTGTSSTVVVPGLTGKIFTVVRYSIITTKNTGTMSGGVTYRFGNSTSPGNMLPNVTLQPSVFTGAAPSVATQQNVIATQAPLVPGDTMTVDITGAATGTGGFDLKLKFVLYGTYVDPT